MTPEQARVIEAAKAWRKIKPKDDFDCDFSERFEAGLHEIEEALDALAKSEQQPPAADVCECGHDGIRHVQRWGACFDSGCKCPQFRPAKETP